MTPFAPDVNTNPKPIRLRKEYRDLAVELGKAMKSVSDVVGNPQARYQSEIEELEAISIIAYKLKRYIENNAWKNPSSATVWKAGERL